MIDNRFGFPVLCTSAPTVKIRGETVLDVNANKFRFAVMFALAIGHGSLTGNQVRFVRLELVHTLQQFGALCGVTHVTVWRWESYGDEPTRMGKATEYLIRCVLLGRAFALEATRDSPPRYFVPPQDILDRILPGAINVEIRW